ncbi:MAG: prepilin-type N-terminal cleavage/methylation domain-containing protein [Phycisphaera sp.]|nr:prepilin-type N-terminal cleavage/methylation domain-containing protein [Phycisphaera sp.]
MNRSDPNRTRRPGFTIVELLVVMSIIVLLLAILLPSAARAKEAARRAICASQQHQLGVFCLEYATDNLRMVFPGQRDWYPKINDEHTPWINTRMYAYIADHSEIEDAKAGTHGFEYDKGVVPVLNCPNYDNRFSGRGRVTASNGPVGWVIGFNYLGGKPQLEAYNRANPIAGSNNKTWRSGVRMSDPGTAGLWADFNNWSPVDHWTFVAHTNVGAAQTMNFNNTPFQGVAVQELDSAGGNVGTLDGSVVWKDINEMNQHHSYSKNKYYPAMW